MAELLYTTQIINNKDEELLELHSQRYSMGYMDFFFTENNKEIDFVMKHWIYKTNVHMSLKNAKNSLNKFKDRYNRNKNNNLYLDNKSEQEISTIFQFLEDKIETIQNFIDENPDEELYLFADLSEVLYMYDLEKDIAFGENRIKQEKYINDLIDGKFSEQLEAKEMTYAKEKLKEIRTAFLRQARIIYIPELSENPTLWKFNNNQFLIRTKFIVQVYEKPLLDTPQHNEIITFALKAIEPSVQSRNTVVEFFKEESEEYLKDGKIILHVNMLVDMPD